MDNFFLIFASFILGFGLKFSSRFPSNSHKVLNAFVICVSFPAVVFLNIPKLFQTTVFDLKVIIPISMAWITFGLSWLVFGQLGKYKKWSKARTGAIILTAGLGNTSFVGLPLLDALVGKEAISWGILIDQLGSFLVLSTLGLTIAAKYGHSDSIKDRSILKQVVLFPPFMALVLSSIIGFFNIQYPQMLSSSINILAQTLVPLALFAVGFQLKISTNVLKRYWKVLCLGLAFKLIFIPMILFGFYYSITGEIDFILKVTILEAAMATMITSAVVASDFNLDEELANLMVGISIPISLISVPLWNYFL